MRWVLGGSLLLASAGCAEPTGRDLGAPAPEQGDGKFDDADADAEPSADAHTLRCDEANARVLDCAGYVNPAFFEACVADPSAQTLEELDAIVAAQCESDPEGGQGDGGGEPGAAAEAFAAVCAPAIVAGALINRFRNRDRGRPLPADVAEMLRPYYGDLVDEVVVYYDATIVNEWEVLGHPIRIGFEVAGQTLAHRIYIADRQRPGQERLLAHEMAHFKQARCLAEPETGRHDLVRFAHRYCKELFLADFQYHPHRLEVGANLVEDEIMSCHWAAQCQPTPVECVDACNGAACHEDLESEP